VNAHADELIDGKVVHPARTQIGDLFWGDAVNAHGNKLVWIRMIVAELLDLRDEICGK
jgi:hypothetical protein